MSNPSNYELACDAAIFVVAPLYDVTEKQVTAVEPRRMGKAYFVTVGEVAFTCMGDHKLDPLLIRVVVQVGGVVQKTYVVRLPINSGRGGRGGEIVAESVAAPPIV